MQPLVELRIVAGVWILSNDMRSRAGAIFSIDSCGPLFYSENLISTKKNSQMAVFLAQVPRS